MPLFAHDFQAPVDVREANDQRFRRSAHAAEPCFFCGRPLTEKAIANGWMVHMTTGGELVPQDYPGDDSQGCFPIGSECAKRIPRPFKFKWES